MVLAAPARGRGRGCWLHCTALHTRSGDGEPHCLWDGAQIRGPNPEVESAVVVSTAGVFLNVVDRASTANEKSETKIRNLRIHIRIKENIARFQITMNNTQPILLVQCRSTTP